MGRPPHLARVAPQLAAGIVDVKAPSIQSSDELAWAAEDLLRLVPTERLWLCPIVSVGVPYVPLSMTKVGALVAAARLVGGRTAVRDWQN